MVGVIVFPMSEAFNSASFPPDTNVYLDHSQVSGTSNAGSINPQDYGPVDPVPSSKASIQAGPIQHDTPLMPYIPPSPPAPSSP
uniref:Uncharacterized protein n=1 Tax=Daucus carota subsp. sativus TaxID=79200 RepID=A0A164X167_DAUCS